MSPAELRRERKAEVNQPGFRYRVAILAWLLVVCPLWCLFARSSEVTQRPAVHTVEFDDSSLTAATRKLPTAKPEEVGMSTERLGRIGPAVQKFIDDHRLAGAATIVARRGKVVHFKTYGMRDIEAKQPMRKDTIFRIYSMTKPVISVAAMMLVEQGKLELDAPASKYIPALAKMKVGGAKQERDMTLRDLLRHTAGFPNNVSTDRALQAAGHPALADSTLEEITNRLDVVPLRYQPGKGWHYSFAADVVARLVEIGSGRPLDRALEKLVFEPLGMVDTGFYCPREKWHRFAKVYGNGLKPVAAPQPGTTGPFAFDKPPKFLSGGGGLVSTAGDYMRFCLMLSNRGQLDGRRLLKAETVRLMTRDQLPAGVGEITRPPAGRGFGLGFAVRVRKVDSEPSSLGEYEWLGGAGTEFWLSPKDELAVVTLSQSLPMRSLGAAVKPLVYAALNDADADNQSSVLLRPRKYLLLDSRVVGKTRNARLTPGTVKKHAANPVFGEDKPWEPRFDNMYPNVIYDREEGLYKCWYSPFIVDQRTTSTPVAKRRPEAINYMAARPARREEALLYATSRDGIHWRKPALGIVEFQGSKHNNIVCRGLGGCGVIKDRRETNPERRYKAFYCTNSGYKMRYSPDGLHWGGEVALPGVGQSDTHANMLWAPELKRYVGILRHFDPIPVTGNRKIARTESNDSLSWTKSKTILEGSPQKQLHDMVIFRDGGVYLGLLGCMHYPSTTSRHRVRQHIELTWSPDTYTWHRVCPGTPLIAPTPAVERKFGKTPYDWGCLFPSVPILRDHEIRIYYGASDWYFFDWRNGGLALATLRPNGWAGYEPVDRTQAGEVTTTPVAIGAGSLRLSADVSPGGSVQVALVNDDEKELAVSDPVSRTVTRGRLTWPAGPALARLRGRRLRLRFSLRQAKLYSFQFALDAAGIR